MATNPATVHATTVIGGMSRRIALGRLAGGATALVAPLGPDRARAQATPAPQAEEGAPPNHFALAGEETQITYDASTDAGEPQLIYDGPYGSQSIAGDELRTEESALGRLVTAHLGAFPDQGDLWLTLLLPRFTPMTSDDAAAPVKTLAILKWGISTIAGPPRTGALDEYRVVPLAGTAQLVLI
jgi:hypothetical protein